MHNQVDKTGLAGHRHSTDPALRKQELLREGEYFRSGVAHAKAQIRHGARPDVILHGALDHATSALRSRADALLRPTGANVSALLPYGMAAFHFVRRHRLGKQVGAAAILLGVLGWYVHKRRSEQ